MIFNPEVFLNVAILRKALGPKYLNADPKQKVDPGIFIGMDHWEDVFGNDRKLWEVLTEISGASGIPAIISKKYDSGSYIIKAGDFDQKLVGMVKGQADIMRQGRKFATFGEGEWIGEMAITNIKARTADVYVKKGPVKVIEIAWSIAEIEMIGYMFGSLIGKIACSKLDHTLAEMEKMKFGLESMTEELNKLKAAGALPRD